jgi:hypothetical protein
VQQKQFNHTFAAVINLYGDFTHSADLRHLHSHTSAAVINLYGHFTHSADLRHLHNHRSAAVGYVYGNLHKKMVQTCSVLQIGEFST